ncbi:MAG TPA: T9SS type A sorting domain-containing protein [Prolixibacteraceae bacterium]|nr:T9SS type A sorting domain-containing protein [Prolixibacteraceae bacterium]
MKKNILLSFLFFPLLPLVLTAQTLPLKCGMFTGSGYTKAVSTGKCPSYTVSGASNEYFVYRGLTLGTIESQICKGIHQSWNSAYPGITQDMCYITSNDSSEFEIHSYGRAKCSSDDSWFSLQCMTRFKLSEEEKCETPEPQPDDPSLISIFNHVPGLTPSEKELWSGTDEDSPPVLKICADGSKATRITFISNNPEVHVSDVSFRVESDPGGDDMAYFGKFFLHELKNNTVSYDFRHPDYLPSSITKQSREDKLVIRYGTKVFKIPVEIYRAPVILVHGLWSDRIPFLKMRDELVADNYYPATLIYPVDYHKWSGSSLQTNARIVPDHIRVMLNICRYYHFSAGGVDVVGHSMGGLISRLYIQSAEYPHRNDIHKLITINTPHSGTQLANFLISTDNAASLAGRLVGEIIINKSTGGSLYDGAMHDMAVNSPAMNDLNVLRLNHSIVPARSITTQAPVTMGNWMHGIYCAVSPILALTTVSVPTFFFGNQLHDMMVTVPSQTGGLPVINTRLINNQVHIFSTQNPAIIQDVEEALGARSTDPDVFCQTGFHPVAQTSPYKSASILAPADIIPGSLTISAPLRNQSFNNGNYVPVSLSSKNGINRIILEAINLPDKIFVKDTAFSSGTVPFTIPSDAFGKVTFLALGYQNGTLTGFDTLSVNVNPPSSWSLDSIQVSEKTVCVEEKKTTSISVDAWYRNNVHFDVSRSAGLKLQMADTTIARLDPSGQIWGKKAGITVLSVSYASKSVNLPVMVVPEYTGADTVSTALEEIKSLRPEPSGEITNFRIYPNPASGSFTASCQLNQQGEITISITDVYGKLIHKWHEVRTPGNHQFTSGTRNLPAGIYLVQLRTGVQTETRKLVVR